MRAATPLFLAAFVACAESTETVGPKLPEHTAHAGCLVVGVSARHVTASAEVPLELTFDNECDVPVEVDTRRVKVEAMEDGAIEGELKPDDPRPQEHPGLLAPKHSAAELLAFGPVDKNATRVCVDPSDVNVLHPESAAGMVCLGIR